jgi:hypothetical protein
MDKTGSSQSEENQVHTKTMKIKHDINAAATTTTNGIHNNRNIDSNYNNKIIILIFGDIHKSQ